MHLVPAPAVRLMKRRVQSRPGARQENRFPKKRRKQRIDSLTAPLDWSFHDWSYRPGAKGAIFYILSFFGEARYKILCAPLLSLLQDFLRKKTKIKKTKNFLYCIFANGRILEKRKTPHRTREKGNIGTPTGLGNLISVSVPFPFFALILREKDILLTPLIRFPKPLGKRNRKTEMDNRA